MIGAVKQGLISTNTNCTGCNKCIKSCMVMGACIATDVLANENSFITVDGDRCITCGACFDACEHGARAYEDDTARFFDDLNRGEAISVLIAPSLRAGYPDRYESILGALRAAGARHMISVSFGADIATWGMIKYIQENDFHGAISQACPVVVDYIEKYAPELIPLLMPVQSPLMCTAIYARNQLGIHDKFAFISPCIAKKIEIDDPENKGIVSYNVTFDHLLKYLREHDIEGEPCSDEVPYDLGAIWPMPGGLADYARLLVGEDAFMRQISGEKRLVDYLRSHEESIKNRETPALFIDALNCEGGCLCGTATEMRLAGSDSALFNLVRIKQEVRGKSKLTDMSPDERMEELERRFGSLDLKDYVRSYHDKSNALKLGEPTDAELSEIFREMRKPTAESRSIDCTACGYESCREMAFAIYHGFNRKENCIHYLKESVESQSQKILYIAEHDEYLDVYNHRAILKRIEDIPDGAGYALAVVDLNRFSSINEAYGHKEADRILAQVSGSLKRRAAEFGGSVARVKEDEFLVLYPERGLSVDSPEILAAVEAVESPVIAGEDEISLTARVGVANAELEQSPEKNIENARLAMGPGTFFEQSVVNFYGDTLKAHAEEELEIRKALMDMVENDGFYMLYQPQVDVASGEVHGFEALVRAKGRALYPGKFIPVAEINGLIWKIGRITTELVIRQLAAWREQGVALRPVSINFSSIQLGDEGYIAFLEQLMETYAIPADLVEIEITESVFVGKTSQAISLFERLKDMGITLLMDDFGTGYSSLGYLTYIPVDVVKLDKSLVDTYLAPGKDRFVQNVIRLVHDLGKEIIVEGVETREQVDRLKEFGADIIQGYYYSKPLFPDEAISFSTHE